MTYDDLVNRWPEAQEKIQAKAAGLPGAYEEFVRFRSSLPSDAQIALNEAYESEITDNYTIE